MSVMLAQIAWKGTVSQWGYMNIRPRLPSAKTTHSVSITPAGQGQPIRRLLADELIALTPDGLDQVEAELGADAPYAHVHHVGAGIEIVAPDGGEQRPPGTRLPGVLGGLPQEQELQPGQRHGTAPDVRDQLADV